MNSRGKLLFNFDDPFLRDVRRRVDRYFRLTKQSKRGGLAMQVKCVLICTWAIASYLSLLTMDLDPIFGVFCCISLGLAIAIIGMAVQHDGAHNAAANSRFLNRFWASTLDAIGGSSYFWKWKHNVLHHGFVNVDGFDDDISLGVLGRLSPDQRRFWFHRYQHVYLWTCYPLLGIKWHLFDDWLRLFTGKFGDYQVPKPKGRDLTKLIAMKVTSYTIAIVIPMLLYGWQIALIGYLLTLGVAGFTMSIVFQLAHVVEGSKFTVGDDSGAIREYWGRHQVESTMNFASGIPGVVYILGGLNYQIEHHLFPSVCHVHYPMISRIVRSTCQRHGVRYRSDSGVLRPLLMHYQHLRKLGRDD